MKTINKMMAVFALVPSVAMGQQTVYVCHGSSYFPVEIGSTQDVTFSQSQDSVCLGSYTYRMADIDSVSFVAPTGLELLNGKVLVEYASDDVCVLIPPSAAGVSGTVSGADVRLVSSNSADELTYQLSGTSSDGSLVYVGSYKCTFILNGLSLTSTSGPAIDIECGKRIAMVLADGTSSVLTDCSDGSQKACLYTKGHLELQGGGELTVKGNTRHAIASKEYLELKKSLGKLTVSGAVADGIHAGQYIKVKGGTVEVKNVGDDAIQAEVTDDATDELNGQILVSGGSISYEVTAEDAKGMRSDSLMAISGGTITGVVSGNAAKAMKSDTEVSISGGEISLTLSGAPVVTDYDPSYCTGVKANQFTMSGGTLTVNASGVANKGVSVDSVANVTGGTLTITTTGDGGTYSSSASSTDAYASCCLKVDGDAWLEGGTYTFKSTGTGGKCIKVDGTLTIGTDDSAPVMDLQTTGSSIGSSGDNPGGGGNNPGGGGGRPGGRAAGGPGGWGQDTSSSASSKAKAVRVGGVLTVNNCDMTVQTATDGSEGLESKSDIVFNGGDIYAKCYDDCVNASGKITVNGGRIYCWSTGNDAVDSNSSQTGAVTLNGGVLLALSAAGAPEEGIDSDNASLCINGGYLFTMGGAQSSTPSVPTSSTAVQPTALLKSMALTLGQYLSVFDSSGNTLFTLKIPFSLSQNYSVVTCPGFVKGSKYTVKTGTAAPTNVDSEWNGFSTGGTSSASTTKKTISFTSNYVSL